VATSALRSETSPLGWTLEHQTVELMYRLPVDIHVDEWVVQLLDTVERVDARRVLIDSLTDLQPAAGLPTSL
jgi:circadian clock protein KaiC